MSEHEHAELLNYGRDFWELESRDRSARRYQHVFQLYVFAGLATGLAALFYYLFRQIHIALSPEDRSILLVAGTGFATAILSAGLLFFQRQSSSFDLERTRYLGAASEFLVEWVKFESAGRERLNVAGQRFNAFSVRDIISGLALRGFISHGDTAVVEEALRFRNALVHDEGHVDQQQLRRMTDAVRSITGQLGLQSSGAVAMEVEEMKVEAGAGMR